MEKVIVKLEKFSKSYGKKEVIKNVNLDVYENEFLTLLGSSGCGKTTMLRSISGLDSPTSGSVYIDGVNVTDLDPTKREVNTIFQNYALFPLMTVYDNIAFGLKMKKVNKNEIKTRVNEMLELVHLVGYENRYPSELSGGEQQRVSLARGLINKPKVLLLDEPLSALDLKLRKEMQIELKRLQRKLKITFIYVTHDQDEALSMSDRIAVVRNGNIEQIDTPSNIYDKPKTLYVASFIGDANIIHSSVSKIVDNIVYLSNNMSFVCGDRKYASGDKITVVIRPENLELSKRKVNQNCIEGVIEELIYDGASTKLMIKANDEVLKVLIFGNNKQFNVHDNIYVTWSMNDMVIFGEKNEK